MALAQASLGYSNIGLRLILRSDLMINHQISAKEGGSGVVQQAMFNGDKVAVKSPKGGGSLSKRDYDRFIEESKIASSVRHQNCVALLGACQDPSDPMLVMEWVAGGNLYDALANNPPAPYVRLKIAREIAAAVDYLHRCRIIHGDMKSLNVLLTSDFSAKVCDFGSAIQKLQFSSIISTSSPVQRTVPWSAPELLTGGRATPQSDMYAVGVIFWELATCEAPFHDRNPNLLSTAIIQGLKLDIPNPLPAGFPPAFFEMIQRCWSEPNQRPSAHDFLAFLIKIDPTSRPSVPLLLFPENHVVLHASLLDCIRPGMPRSLDGMLSIMVSQAEKKYRESSEVQSICSEYGLNPMEAHALTVNRILFFI